MGIFICRSKAKKNSQTRIVIENYQINQLSSRKDTP